MSEEKNKHLTVPQVARKLEEKQATRACEACGAQAGWTVPNPTDEDKTEVGQVSILRDGATLNYGENTQGYRFVPVICNNCGHTRFFLTSFLMREAP